MSRVKGRVEALQVDADRVQKPIDILAAEGSGGLQRLGATVPEQQTIAHSKFVAFGVPAEIVMVFQDQDACSRAMRFAIKPGRR